MATAPRRAGIQHYTATGATRTDRFYASNELSHRKIAAETVVAAITDHHAVVLKLDADVSTFRRGRGIWKRNTSLLTDAARKARLDHQWGLWKRQKRHFPEITLWWCRSIKKKLKQFYIQEGVEQRRNHREMENQYYACIYDILRDDRPHAEKATELHRFKAKLIRLHNARMQSVMLDTEEADRMVGENPTLFQVLGRQKRRTAHVVQLVQDEDGHTHISPKDILHAFTTYFKEKYETIAVNEECIAAMSGLGSQAPLASNGDLLEWPIDMDEILYALWKGKRNKAPRSDGIGLAFYVTNWTTIKEDLRTVLNRMFIEKTITTQQKDGLLVCVPKSGGARGLSDFRRITLLNVDYKLLARIMAHRLRLLLPAHLLPAQFCSVPGNTILEAVATVREVIARRK